MTIYGKDKFVAKSSEDVEEEPNVLDAAVADDLGEEDELDEGVEVIDGEEDEDEDEPASPLAEDAPPAKVRKPKEPVPMMVDAEEDLENTPGVRTSGDPDVTAMSRTDRQREFPSVPRPQNIRRKGGPRKGQRRGAGKTASKRA